MYRSAVGQTLLLFFTLTSPYTSGENGCGEKGWFGSSCEFLCRCLGGHDACDQVTGACDGQCQTGWFGPACQYAATPFLTEDEYSWLLNETRCSNESSTTVRVTFEEPRPFTWLRGSLRTARGYGAPVLQLTNANGGTVPCEQDFYLDMVGLTFDLYCPTPRLVEGATLSGSLVPHLCSLYISGGRNVALRRHPGINVPGREPTPWASEYAVDGQVAGDRPGHVCAATRRLTLPLPRPVRVQQLIFFYMVQDKNASDVWSINMYLHNASVLNINMKFPKEFNRDGEIFTKRLITPGVYKKVDVAGANNEELVICELEVFGDTECPDGHYGRMCELECACDGPGRPCHVATGHCISTCPEGSSGGNCPPQPTTKTQVRLEDEDNRSGIGTAMGMTAFLLLGTGIAIMLVLAHKKDSTSRESMSDMRSLRNSLHKFHSGRLSGDRDSSDSYVGGTTPMAMRHFLSTNLSAQSENSKAASFHDLANDPAVSVSVSSMLHSRVDPIHISVSTPQARDCSRSSIVTRVKELDFSLS